MRAIIMAGGLGTRLRPYTTLIPKPLVPIGNQYSVLEIVLIQLRNQGFTHVTLAVNHFSNLIMAYFGDGAKIGLKIDYSLEESPLGTIGPLALIADLPENFLVMNGDILCDLSYAEFLRNHSNEESKISVSAYTRQVNIDFGVLELDHEGQLEGFIEKPKFEYLVSMGVYALNRSVVEGLTPGMPYGFDSLMLDSLNSGPQVSVKPFTGFWLDIGRPDDYQYADENFNTISEKLGLNLRN